MYYCYIIYFLTNVLVPHHPSKYFWLMDFGFEMFGLVWFGADDRFVLDSDTSVARSLLLNSPTECPV